MNNDSLGRKNQETNQGLTRPVLSILSDFRTTIHVLYHLNLVNDNDTGENDGYDTKLLCHIENSQIHADC